MANNVALPIRCQLQGPTEINAAALSATSPRVMSACLGGGAPRSMEASGRGYGWEDHQRVLRDGVGSWPPGRQAAIQVQRRFVAQIVGHNSLRIIERVYSHLTTRRLRGDAEDADGAWMIRR
jgi:hypothetical protein